MRPVLAAALSQSKQPFACHHEAAEPWPASTIAYGDRARAAVYSPTQSPAIGIAVELAVVNFCRNVPAAFQSGGHDKRRKLPRTSEHPFGR